MTTSELVKIITKNTDCYLIEHGANHDKWINPNTGRKFTIPRHQSKEIHKKTAESILKSAGVK